MSRNVAGWGLIPKGFICDESAEKGTMFRQCSHRWASFYMQSRSVATLCVINNVYLLFISRQYSPWSDWTNGLYGFRSFSFVTRHILNTLQRFLGSITCNIHCFCFVWKGHFVTRFQFKLNLLVLTPLPVALQGLQVVLFVSLTLCSEYIEKIHQG